MTPLKPHEALKNRVMRKPCISCDGTGVLGPLKSCEECLGTGVKHVRCSQCWTWKRVSEFIGKRGGVIGRCASCAEKYANWGKQSLAERSLATSPRGSIQSDGPLRVSIVMRSGNRKTGPIPVTMTSAVTCPTRCPLMNKGCYAEQHMLAIHWRRISSGQRGLDWEAFCDKIAALPEGTLWRHNEAGDLPGTADELDSKLFRQLVHANRGRRGFTYTHKPLTPKNVADFRWARLHGFTVNISTDSLEEADQAAQTGLPVTTVLPHDVLVKGNKTPEGRAVVVCPAELHDHVTCESCQLCQVYTRKCIVGFRAHGDRKKQISEQYRQLPIFQGGTI